MTNGVEPASSTAATSAWTSSRIAWGLKGGAITLPQSTALRRSVRPHRLQRTLRRHLALFDVLQRASAAPEAWSGHDAPTRAAMTRAAFARWYGS